MTFNNGYALIIGVGADLKTTVTDATAIKRVLVDPQKAAYPPEQVVLLTEKEAGRNNILRHFDELAKKLKDNPDASVLIYYSGHGRILKETGEYFLVPNGFSDNRLKETWISGAEFSLKIDQLAAKKMTVFLDCCHAAGMPEATSKGEVEKYAKNVSQLAAKLDEGSGRAIIASCRDDELSWIFKKDPYSLFTTCLVEAFEGKGAPDGHDGYAKILSVIAYLFDQVPKRSSEQQHPFINRIENLSDNYALCAFPVEMRKAKSESVSKWKDKTIFLLKMELNGLESQAKILTDKLSYFRKVSSSEADPARKFQLEKNILQAKEEQTQALVQMEAIQKLIDEGS